MEIRVCENRWGPWKFHLFGEVLQRKGIFLILHHQIPVWPLCRWARKQRPGKLLWRVGVCCCWTQLRSSDTRNGGNRRDVVPLQVGSGEELSIMVNLTTRKSSVKPLLCSRLSSMSLRAEGARAEAAEAEGRKLSPEAYLIGSLWWEQHCRLQWDVEEEWRRKTLPSQILSSYCLLPIMN